MDDLDPVTSAVYIVSLDVKILSILHQTTAYASRPYLVEMFILIVSPSAINIHSESKSLEAANLLRPQHDTFLYPIPRLTS
jgi:hypothetical protein